MSASFSVPGKSGYRCFGSLKEIASAAIAEETVLNPHRDTNAVLTAVDPGTGTAYFMDIRGHKISLYAHGCKMLKELTGL